MASSTLENTYVCVGGKEKENKERTDEEVNKRNQDRRNEAINDLQLSRLWKWEKNMATNVT